MEVAEGGVSLAVPDATGTDASVFYNPDQEANRDVTLAALRTARHREDNLETYLDAMTATGVRGVRAAADGWTVTCCDRDPDAVACARANLARNDLGGTVRQADANVVLHRGVYDVVDLDPFGSPIPFVDAACVGTARFLCVTATDTAPLCGAHFRPGIRRYDAVPRNTEYHQEVGLRVLLSALARTATRYDIGIEPVLTHVEGHFARTYLRLHRGPDPADAAREHLGFLWHCPECLYRETERGPFGAERATCPACDSDQYLTAGPLWLGPTFVEDFVRETIEHVDAAMTTAARSRRRLDRLAGQLAVPTHYDQHRLCDRWDRPAGPMDGFLGAIRDAGYPASRTQYGGTTFKTTADVDAIRDVTA